MSDDSKLCTKCCDECCLFKKEFYELLISNVADQKSVTITNEDCRSEDQLDSKIPIHDTHHLKCFIDGFEICFNKRIIRFIVLIIYCFGTSCILADTLIENSSVNDTFKYAYILTNLMSCLIGVHLIFDLKSGHHLIDIYDLIKKSSELHILLITTAIYTPLYYGLYSNILFNNLDGVTIWGIIGIWTGIIRQPVMYLWFFGGISLRITQLRNIWFKIRIDKLIETQNSWVFDQTTINRIRLSVVSTIILSTLSIILLILSFIANKNELSGVPFINQIMVPLGSVSPLLAGFVVLNLFSDCDDELNKLDPENRLKHKRLLFGITKSVLSFFNWSGISLGLSASIIPLLIQII